MGKKTGAWTTTITYDPADINTANLKQYDAIFLDSTTGCFLDDPNDQAATDARRAALLAFVRGGKGLAGIHAATDSYHGASCGGGAPAGGAPGGGAPGGGRAGGPGAGGPGGNLANAMIAQGDKDGDQKLSRAELSTLASAWFDRLDPEKTGRVAQADFGPRFASLTPAPAPPGPRQRGGLPLPRCPAASRSGRSATRSSAATSSSTGSIRSSSP